ncbi:MAG: UDP-N-acetylmuramate:L-alanyl-gamma-D-glutamyl-meso-diaminopimelate ligase [Ectothiorhodospiraceae bacterium]|nr:UDP-N-acetylmuramate:L-alanyl-gamma-D-glutamyl-meso-diaminopimelate ligase [Ectothiorhodospiraceae bacterium]
MRVHMLGICGTFMGGLALLARALGHAVSGADANVYPPMSEQLAAAGIALTDGYAEPLPVPTPDVVVVGNALTRGVPVVEQLLESTVPFTSGPAWLAEHVLRGRHVLAVSGTHGKTTTASMLAFVLDRAGLEPGFLIGGVPHDFGVSARLGGDRRGPFVVEADEYDSAFFDKRSKFVHYHPRTLVINGIEFDHADIFDDVSQIRRQFHHLVRTLPATARIVVPAADPEVDATLALGCWSALERLDGPTSRFRLDDVAADGGSFCVVADGERHAVSWGLIGHHNVRNALATVVAAEHVGVDPAAACRALASFGGVRRRLEVRARTAGITVYDDFAHHPTAIRETLGGLRARVGAARILAVLDPASNTMRRGVHRATLGPALDAADRAWVHRPPSLGFDPEEIARTSAVPVAFEADIDRLVAAVVEAARPGDHVLVMSNGGFGGFHHRLARALEARSGTG